MTALLASVRDLAEADVAVTGGCDWLDLKEPSAGALGAVSIPTMRDVVARYSGRLPISATIGDCWDQPEWIAQRVARVAGTGVDYVKIGLYAQRAEPKLLGALAAARALFPRLIAVCFAERPPTPADVESLVDCGFAGMMLDTADKRAGSLTTWLGLDTIAEFVGAVRRHGLLVGLAGSLGAPDVPRLLPLGADYLGFRGALCASGTREQALDPSALQAIKRLVSDAQSCVAVV